MISQDEFHPKSTEYNIIHKNFEPNTNIDDLQILDDDEDDDQNQHESTIVKNLIDDSMDFDNLESVMWRKVNDFT